MITNVSKQDGKIYRTLTIEEQIREYHLIQSEIDIEGFRLWYEELDRDEQIELSHQLLNVFLCELPYSGDREVVMEVVRRASTSLESPHIKMILSFVGDFDLEKGFIEYNRPRRQHLMDWLYSLKDDELKAVFELCVYFFGIHEAIGFKACGGRCQHWWHQDLKDPKVVEELIRTNQKNRPTDATIPPAPEKNNSQTFFRKFFGLK